jgi:hypothetical protein
MRENRRLRFAEIDGLDRSDLPLAAEVWLEDIKSQSWASRDIVKLATLFLRYLLNPTPEMLRLSRIERICQLDRMQVLEALRLMQVFGAVDAYAVDGDSISVSLNLGLLQRFRVLSVRKKFEELLSEPRPNWPEAAPMGEEKWRPDKAIDILDDPDTAFDVAGEEQ